MNSKFELWVRDTAAPRWDKKACCLYTKTPRWDKKARACVNNLKWAYEDDLDDVAEEQKRREWIANTKACMQKRKAEKAQLEGFPPPVRTQKLGEVPPAGERA